MPNYICRLCQNTAQWTRPTLKFGEHKQAYTSEFGFGMEEWLNREEWLLSGYPGLEGKWRYAHLTSMWTPNHIHNEENVDILFYIKERGQKAQAVGYLNNAFVLDEKEAAWAVKQFSKNKWINLMRAEVNAIGGNVEGFPRISKDTASWYINIRFRPGSLRFFDDRKLINVSSYYYGNALPWDGHLPTENYHINAVTVPPKSTETGERSERDLARFSEDIRNRRAAAGKPFLPRQAPIQNALALQLDDFYRPLNGKVKCEDEYVDIKLLMPGKLGTFIEIKPASSARKAIRLALGQLIEYSIYPSIHKADKLVIVSDAEPMSSDFEYLNHLKNNYSIPVSYIYWPLGANKISEEQLKLFN
jgi:hypothetical protein